MLSYNYYIYFILESDDDDMDVNILETSIFLEIVSKFPNASTLAFDFSKHSFGNIQQIEGINDNFYCTLKFISLISK